MKKLFLSILMLFNFSFAGETGYVWLAGSEDIKWSSYNIHILHSDEQNLIPIKNSSIKILKNNIIIKDKQNLEKTIKEFREQKESLDYYNSYKCFYLYSFLYNSDKEEKFCNINKNNIDYSVLEKNVIAKVINIEKYIEGVFLEIEIIGEFEELKKEIKSKKPIEEETLCDTKEDSIFSCETQNNKIISLCKNRNNTLGYKFGTKDKIELEYSSKENNDINKYFKNYLYYGMHNYSFELLFSKNKYDYIIYKYKSNNGFDNLSGVLIKKDNKKLSEIKCKYPLENNNQFYNIENFNISVLDSSIL